MLKKHSISLTVRCHFTAQWHYMIGDAGHLGYWQPYWKNVNIWTVFITLVEHFLCLKHKIYYYHYLSQPFAALLRQKIGFQDSPWRPYWKIAAILKFCVARVFSWRVTPIDYLYQILCLYHNLNDSSDICNYLLHYYNKFIAILYKNMHTIAYIYDSVEHCHSIGLHQHM